MLVRAHVYLPLAALLCIASGFSAHAQASPGRPAQRDKVVFHKKFEQLALAPAAAVAPLFAGSGYASIRYSIGTSDQRDAIQDVISEMAKTLPESLGNSSGTYTITITLTDPAGKVVAQEPILSFQWTVQRGLFAIDKAVDNIRKTSWKGTLLDRVLVNGDSRKFRVSVEVYSQKDRSLDFDLLKKTATLFSSGALAALYPLPAAALPVIDGIGDLANSIYANSRKDSLIDTEELSLDGTAKPLNQSISVGQYDIPVNISVDVSESRLVAGRLSDGKFKALPDESIFKNIGIEIAPGKSVGIVELISTSNDGSMKSTRSMLDATMSGVSYGKDPSNQKEANSVPILCGNLYDALNLYLSKYDARAMFWAFLRRYGDQTNKSACLGSRQSALAEVGLTSP